MEQTIEFETKNNRTRMEGEQLQKEHRKNNEDLLQRRTSKRELKESICKKHGKNNEDLQRQPQIQNHKEISSDRRLLQSIGRATNNGGISSIDDFLASVHAIESNRDQTHREQDTRVY